MNRARLAQEYCAVTGACLVVRKDLFLAVGGLDEVDLKVAFNDVDLCLRLRAQGHIPQYTPFAELFHHESASRGFDLAGEALLRFQREINTMERRWGSLLLNDPAYNPNLTLRDEDFSLRYEPRPEPGPPAPAA
jgi:GT2 family glycosyltransferase